MQDLVSALTILVVNVAIKRFGRGLGGDSESTPTPAADGKRRRFIEAFARGLPSNPKAGKPSMQRSQ